MEDDRFCRDLVIASKDYNSLTLRAHAGVFRQPDDVSFSFYGNTMRIIKGLLSLMAVRVVCVEVVRRSETITNCH